jgi:hypothetical protein
MLLVLTKFLALMIAYLNFTKLDSIIKHFGWSFEQIHTSFSCFRIQAKSSSFSSQDQLNL